MDPSGAEKLRAAARDATGSPETAPIITDNPALLVVKIGGRGFACAHPPGKRLLRPLQLVSKPLDSTRRPFARRFCPRGRRCPQRVCPLVMRPLLIREWISTDLCGIMRLTAARATVFATYRLFPKRRASRRLSRIASIQTATSSRPRGVFCRFAAVFCLCSIRYLIS